MGTKYQARTASQWQSIMDEFAISGLTQTAFCQQQGLAMSTFSKWRKQLGLVSPTHNEGVAFQPLTPEWPTASPSAALSVPVLEGAESIPSTNWQVELTLGAGVVLRTHSAG